MRKAKRLLLNTHGTQLPEEQKEEEDLPESPQHVHRRREVHFRARRVAIVQLLGRAGPPCVRACVRSVAVSAAGVLLQRRLHLE